MVQEVCGVKTLGSKRCFEPSPFFTQCLLIDPSRAPTRIYADPIIRLRDFDDRAVKKMGFLGSPRRFLILPGDRAEERPVFPYLQAGFFTLFQPKFSEILLKMGVFSL